MKRIYFLSLLCGGLLFTTACSTPGGTSTSSVKSYPLSECIVSGSELGVMGQTRTLVHNNQEVKLCCSNCVKKFEADPDKYMQRLAEAM